MWNFIKNHLPFIILRNEKISDSFNVWVNPGKLLVSENGLSMNFLTQDQLTFIAMTGPDFAKMSEPQRKGWFFAELLKASNTIRPAEEIARPFVPHEEGGKTFWPGCNEFIQQVRNAPVGILWLSRTFGTIQLQVVRSAEDNEVVATYHAPKATDMREIDYAEFKRRLGEVLSEPAVYARVAVFGEKEL